MRTADVEAAFLRGIECPRGLYMEQPTRGLPGVEPGVLLEIKEGIFGFATSPRQWWSEISNALLDMQMIVNDGARLKFVQSRLDPCWFLLRDEHGSLVGQLVTHVDDINLAVDPRYEEAVQNSVSDRFGLDEWEEQLFTRCRDHSIQSDSNEELRVCQQEFTERRLDELPSWRGGSGDRKATAAEAADNQSAVGALSWLANQTRPDLATITAMCQKRQNDPCVDDLKLAGRAIREAKQSADLGLTYRGIDFDQSVLLFFHDAALANVTSEGGVIWYDKSAIDEGRVPITDVFSQLGNIIVAAHRDVVAGKAVPVNILDWRTHTSKRVVRSTFAAETMSCAEGLEAAIAIRALLVEATEDRPDLQHISPNTLPVVAMTDAKSLFDALHKEGGLRVPSEKRLIIDLSAIKQMLIEVTATDEVDTCEALTVPLRWVPTELQLADGMTKIMRHELLKSIMRGQHLQLPLLDNRQRWKDRFGSKTSGGANDNAIGESVASVEHTHANTPQNQERVEPL